DLLIFMDQHFCQNVAIALIPNRAHGGRRCTLAVDAQRWHSNHLPRLDATVGLYAASIDTHLAGAQQLLQLTEGKPRIMNFEPAIQAHARFAVFYSNLFYASHIVTISAGIALQKGSCEPQSRAERKNGTGNASNDIDDG